MAQIRRKGAAEDSPVLEVSDDSLDQWTSLGYVQVGAKKPAKKAAAKRTSAKK